jgi:ribosomal protein S18 acetylase RimI-like enzyme
VNTPQANQEPWHIRSSFRPGDIGWITYLHGVLYAQEYGWDHTFDGYLAEGLARFALSFDARKDCLWIAEKDEEIVGFIAIAGHSDSEAQLRWFLVHPSQRLRGLGRLLLNKALDFCREHTFSSVFLWTVSDLKVAARLYRSVGFRKTNEKKHHIWGKTLTEEMYELAL